MASTLVVEIQNDGSVKTNAQKVSGSEAEILAMLEELAGDLGGELTVEKHAPGVHHHHHGDGNIHHKH